MEIINVREHPEYKDRAIAYFQDKWANEQSRMVYDDSITRSLVATSPLPVWYLLVDGEEIVGCAGLITNDFISCTDLWPWLCALYIEESHRGQSLGNMLMDRAGEDAGKMGFPHIYLCTDHVGYYEKYGFRHIATGYHPWGESSRVYERETGI